MAALKCDSCGAPLDPNAEGGVVTCTFCQSRVRVPSEPKVVAPHERPAHIPRDSEAIARPRTGVGRMFAVTILLGAAAVAVSVLLKHGASSTSKPAPSLRGPNLKTLGDSETTIERLDPNGMIGQLGAFDPVANFPWAQKLATTWSADARLIKLKVEEMSAEGALDLSEHGPGRVTYEFASPGRHAAGLSMAKVSSKLVWSAIDLNLKKGVITATVAGDSWLDLGVHELSFGCPPTDLIRIWRGRGLPVRDTYAFELSQATDTGSFQWTSMNWGLKPLSTACKDVK